MFFITGLMRRHVDDNFDTIGNTRTFGYLETYEDAENALNKNMADMHEALYDYAVIEYFESGLYPICWNADRVFFKWDATKNGFFRCDPIPELENICNIAIG